jgi:hypothetical protein
MKSKSTAACIVQHAITGKSLNKLATEYNNETIAVGYVEKLCEIIKGWALAGHFVVDITELDTGFYKKYNPNFHRAVYEQLRSRGMNVRVSNTTQEAWISWRVEDL